MDSRSMIGHCHILVTQFIMRSVVLSFEMFTGSVIDTFLFGRGPNRVMETACFDANVQ